MGHDLNPQMDRFLRQQNLERYRKLLENLSDDIQRRQILNLLKEEEALGQEAEMSAARRAR